MSSRGCTPRSMAIMSSIPSRARVSSLHSRRKPQSCHALRSLTYSCSRLHSGKPPRHTMLHLMAQICIRCPNLVMVRRHLMSAFPARGAAHSLSTQTVLSWILISAKPFMARFVMRFSLLNSSMPQVMKMSVSSVRLLPCSQCLGPNTLSRSMKAPAVTRICRQNL